MGVAEGVDVEDVDVGRGEEEVLDELFGGLVVGDREGWGRWTKDLPK